MARRDRRRARRAPAIPPPRLHHGVGPATWAVLDAAVPLGREIRIGLEDVLTLPDGRRAPDNAALVVEAVAALPLTRRATAGGRGGSGRAGRSARRRVTGLPARGLLGLAQRREPRRAGAAGVEGPAPGGGVRKHMKLCGRSGHTRTVKLPRGRFQFGRRPRFAGARLYRVVEAALDAASRVDARRTAAAGAVGPRAAVDGTRPRGRAVGCRSEPGSSPLQAGARVSRAADRRRYAARASPWAAATGTPAPGRKPARSAARPSAVAASRSSCAGVRGHHRQRARGRCLRGRPAGGRPRRRRPARARGRRSAQASSASPTTSGTTCAAAPRDLEALAGEAVAQRLGVRAQLRRRGGAAPPAGPARPSPPRRRPAAARSSAAGCGRSARGSARSRGRRPRSRRRSRAPCRACR